MFLFAFSCADAREDVAVAIETCAVPTYLGSVPADGDVGLPADTVLTFVFDGAASCGHEHLEVALLHEGVLVGVTVLDDGDGVFRAVPDEPLADGAHVAEVTSELAGELVVGFEVGGTPAPLPAEPEVVLSAGRSCDQVMVTRVEVEAMFPSGSAGSGLFRARISTEDGEVATITRPYAGEPTALFEGQVFGGRELCVTLALEDVTGASAWELEPVCAEEFAGCDFAAPETSSGCSTAPLGGGALLPLALLLARRRVR